MNGIREVADTKDIAKSMEYPITLLWENGEGQRLITQAIYPANLREYLKDKKVKAVGGVFFLGQQINVTTVEALERFCND